MREEKIRIPQRASTPKLYLAVRSFVHHVVTRRRHGPLARLPGRQP